MSVLLLTNSVGDAAADLVLQSGTGVASGYDMKDIIAGPRSTVSRGLATAPNTAITQYLYQNSTYPAGPATLTADYAVIIRGDWERNYSPGDRRWVFYRVDAGPALVSLVDYNALSTMSSSLLVGPRSQDVVVSLGSQTGVGFIFADRTSTAAVSDIAGQVSKVFFSSSFDFGLNPVLASPNLERLPDKTFFTPLKGYDAYAVEARFTLQWQQITKAKVISFLALPQLFNWPLCIYDSPGDVLPWKFEHVLLESVNISCLHIDSYQIDATFLRLKHYD